MIESAVEMCRRERIEPEDLSPELLEGPTGRAPEWVTLAEHTRRYLVQVLAKTGGLIGGPQGAAALLGLADSTLRDQLRRFGIPRPKA